MGDKHKKKPKKSVLEKLQKAIDKGKFDNADKALDDYNGSLDNLVVKNLEAAQYLCDNLKTSVHNFSILKTPLLISLSNFVDKSEVKKLMIYSSDFASKDSALKIASLYCYLDNKNESSFEPNNACLRNILPSVLPFSSAKDSVTKLLTHSKCEPGVDCTALKATYTALYNTHSLVAKIMDGSAKACLRDNCNIVFTYDENYSFKNGSQLPSKEGGYFDLGTGIFVSAKESFYNITFVHELTHYLMQALYHFNSHPYPDPKLPFQPIGFISKKSDFKNVAQAIDSLQKTKVPQNGEQEFLHNLLGNLKTWYPANRVDGELVVRYPEMMASDITYATLNYYLKPLVDYYNTDLIPDINHYLAT
jgi:hypothetical protein